MPYPVIDLHCDLLAYLACTPGSHAENTSDIGCALPYLKQGNVKLQVLAIYTAAEKGSSKLAYDQSIAYQKLIKDFDKVIEPVHSKDALDKIISSDKSGVIVSVENAAGFCEEDGDLEEGFKKLEKIISNAGKILYIGLTHHTENRFGGGNQSSAGLKEDGEKLLNYISERNIAVDFSHTSDALAYGILEYIDKNSLDIPILASHSNFRKVNEHARNLPDDIAMEIIKREGIIGINFIRGFLNPDRKEALLEHIQYGIELGARNNLCFGADFFYTKDSPDPSRLPYYFPEHEDASKYPDIQDMIEKEISKEFAEAISWKNAKDYIEKIIS
jgi:microsomal dipeptidase-like Zn-dependent dipeptidase